MQVTLNVDSSQLGTELSEFLKTLTTEDKNKMVVQLLSDYYDQYQKYDKSEKMTFDREALAYARKEDYSYRDSKYSDDDVRTKSSYYRDFLSRRPTMAEQIRKEISSAIQSELAKTVRKFVDEDPSYKTMVEESMKTIKENFPQLVQAAMVQHMAGQLPALVAQLQNFAGEIRGEVNNLNNRLNSRNF